MFEHNRNVELFYLVYDRALLVDTIESGHSLSSTATWIRVRDFLVTLGTLDLVPACDEW